MNTKVEKTKRSLLDAFCRLAQKQRIEEINVSALCREAGVNRTTFYKYYSLPSDVVVEAVREIAAEASAVQNVEGRRLYDIMLGITKAFYDNRKLMRLFFGANGNPLPVFYQAISPVAEASGYMSKKEHYFLSGGIGGVATYWMQNDFQDSPETIAAEMTRYIAKYVAGQS